MGKRKHKRSFIGIDFGYASPPRPTITFYKFFAKNESPVEIKRYEVKRYKETP
jgi:hypothetical protein